MDKAMHSEFDIRLRIIFKALKHGILPSFCYEKVRHYDCSYLHHLWINICYAWRWATFQELQSDIDFENEQHEN